MAYDQYSEFLLSAATTHNKKIKWESKFGSKYRSILFNIEQFPNDGYEASFGIDSSFGMI